MQPAKNRGGVTKKSTSRRAIDALTAAVGRGVEDITGFQPQQPAKSRKPKKKNPPHPPTPTPPPALALVPAADSDTGDDLSDEEDAKGKRKKPSITQMWDEDQEQELADWWEGQPRLL